MTWTKLSDDFGDQCAALSDHAFRTHVEGLLWSMRRETDGAITMRDLRRFAESRDWMAAVDELVQAGFWEACDNGFLINHHMEHQPESEIIAQRRASTAERVRRHRRKQAGLDKASNAVTNSVTRRVTRDGSGRVGTGRATDSLEEEEVSSTSDTGSSSWPSVVPPGSATAR